MAEAFFTKLPNGTLIPASDEDKEAVDKLKPGQAVRIKFTRVRNLKFHRKWFALARFAYDYWEPGSLDDSKWQGVTPERNFDRFRKDLIILAGYFYAVYRLDGSIRIEPKSIKFENMPEDEFEKLFSKTIDVVIEHVTKQYSGRELQDIVDEAVAFM